MNDAPKALQWWWAQSDDAERYFGPFASRDQAIAAAQAEAHEDHATAFYICTARPRQLHDDIFNADEVLEQFEDHNEEAWGEDGPDMATLPDGAEAELVAALNAAFKAWREKHQPWRAYNLEDFGNGETVPVTGAGAPTGDEP